MTAPLPPMSVDPSVTGGQQVRGDFTSAASAIRGDFSITDILKAQQITDEWVAANAKLAALYADLQSRRRARQATLEALVPIGPGIPADASPADASVMQQAFRSALMQARDASPTELASMLADAERFDDDTMRRAVLTTAVDSSQMGLVQFWTDSLGLTDELTELISLREAVAGQGFDTLWIAQALSPIPQPSEAAELPRLIAARDAAIQARGLAQSRAVMGRDSF